MQVYRYPAKKVAGLVMSIALVDILGSMECRGNKCWLQNTVVHCVSEIFVIITVHLNTALG